MISNISASINIESAWGPEPLREGWRSDDTKKSMVLDLQNQGLSYGPKCIYSKAICVKKICFSVFIILENRISRFQISKKRELYYNVSLLTFDNSDMLLTINT